MLSAQHGLLHPDAVIESYEKTLNKMPIAKRREWATTVIRQLEETAPDVKRVVFLAGRRYREFIADILINRGIDIDVPMLGLGIGKQLAWLKRHAPT